MSTKRITRSQMVEYFGDNIRRYVCDTLDDIAEHFSTSKFSTAILENPTNVKAIAEFISSEVEIGLVELLSDIENDYWD